MVSCLLTAGNEPAKKEVVENVTPSKTEVEEVAKDSTTLETVKDSLTQTVQE